MYSLFHARPACGLLPILTGACLHQKAAGRGPTWANRFGRGMSWQKASSILWVTVTKRGKGEIPRLRQAELAEQRQETHGKLQGMVSK